MRVINICRQIFNFVFMLSTFSYLIMNFREQIPKDEKEENEKKETSKLFKEDKWYDVLQITIVILALIIFLLFVIYGIINKKFLWFFWVMGVPVSLERITHALVSIGVIGNVVKTNTDGRLTFKEHSALFLVSGVVVMLQLRDCFESCINFVTKHFNSITSDLLLLLIHVLVLYIYFFLTCSLIPTLILFLEKLLRKLVLYIPGRSKFKQVGDFFVNKIDKPVKQSHIAVSLLKFIKKKNTILIVLSMPIVMVASVMDIGIFLLNVLFLFVLTSFGYLIIIYRIVKRTLKNMFSALANVSDKKMVGVSFRIAIIAALTSVVIINRYNVVVKNVENSTAVLEFIASTIIIPIVFEWINSGRGNYELKNTKG